VESCFFLKLCEISEKILQFLKVYIEMIKYVIYLSGTQVQITTLITTHMMEIFLKISNYTREIAMLLP
jgi:hypothetical protein